MTVKIWGTYSAEDDDNLRVDPLGGFGSHIPGGSKEKLDDSMIVRAMFVCDGLVTAMIGYIRGSVNIWVSRQELMQRITETPSLMNLFRDFNKNRKEICEEIVLASAKSGNVRSAMWLLERYDPENFGAPASKQINTTETAVQEIPITQPVDVDTWVRLFSGFRKNDSNDRQVN